MSNYNFTPTLNGLNNIEADEIISNSITTSNLTGNLTNAVLTNCTTSADPTTPSNIANKNYIDSNFMFKTGTVSESITGIKTFTNRVNFNGSQCIVATGSSEFVGANGYFMINPNMGSGSFNPASQNGTIGIIGLKDQTTDKVLFTLYGSIHASVKLNFTEGVSIGFGGGTQQGNTSVTCDGTNVIIKPNIKFSGDNTIQNSAFTGAGSLNGTYNLSNITIDANGKITSLSSGLTTANTFTNTNTFNSDVGVQNININQNLSILNAGNIFRMSLNGTTMIFNPTFNSSTVQFKALDSVGGISAPITMTSAQTQIGNLLQTDYGLNSNGTATFNAQATFNNNTPICSVASPTAINHLTRKDYVDNNFVDKTTTQSIAGLKSFTNDMTVQNINVNQNLSILNAGNTFIMSMSGANMIFNPIFNSSTVQFKATDSLGNNNYAPITMTSTQTQIGNILSANYGANIIGDTTISNNLTLRSTKLYNKVKTITGTATTTLTFPLEEHIMIQNTGAINIILPLITATALGMTFNFITNNTFNVTFATSSGSTNNIIQNGFTTGASSAILMYDGITSINLTCLEFTSGTYSWVILNSSLPQPLTNPVGSIIQMANGTIPKGYLECNGGLYDGSIYSALFAVIGYTYGGSAGNFNVIDLRGVFMRGKGTNGIDSTYVSAAYGTLQPDGIKTHTHDILFGYLTTTGASGGQNAYNSTAPNYNNPGTGSGRATGITSSNNNSYNDTRPGNYAVLFCIKY